MNGVYRALPKELTQIKVENIENIYVYPKDFPRQQCNSSISTFVSIAFFTCMLATLLSILLIVRM